MSKWDNRYASEDYMYGTEPNDFLRQEAKHIPSGKVLCLADGEGRNSVFLAGLGYQVTSVDSSKVGLAKAQKLAAIKGVEIETICADLAEFDLGQTKWTGIISIFCHLPKVLRLQVHSAIPSALVTGGQVILEGYNPNQISNATGGPKDPNMLMTASQLKQDFIDLQTEVLQEVDRTIIEGYGHTGVGSVVQYRGTKP